MIASQETQKEPLTMYNCKINIILEPFYLSSTRKPAKHVMHLWFGNFQFVREPANFGIIPPPLPHPIWNIGTKGPSSSVIRTAWIEEKENGDRAGKMEEVRHSASSFEV
ncbi:hypothetical protein CEXT_123111 [Caerostris extrusa]|uniref:Ycf15 n=1 Tax=Caerostris extrusa TaxID=172846 RepID=A0AAV4QJ16_CAEEX|nr:hypothetical protein CEXT_123111 [Caerostris extrusa]